VRPTDLTSQVVFGLCKDRLPGRGAATVKTVPPSSAAPGVRAGRLRLSGWLLAQAGLLGAVAVYVIGYAGPLVPDAGLRQLDLLSLHERVEGVDAVGDRATLVVAAGPQSAPSCAAQVALASTRRATSAGVDPRYPLVVLVPDAASPAAKPGLDVRPDPGGVLARRLVLTRAATGCYPGYAVVDPAGFVRYRSYDPAWGGHGQEQTILLGAVRP